MVIEKLLKEHKCHDVLKIYEKLNILIENNSALDFLWNSRVNDGFSKFFKEAKNFDDLIFLLYKNCYDLERKKFFCNGKPFSLSNIIDFLFSFSRAEFHYNINLAKLDNCLDIILTKFFDKNHEKFIFYFIAQYQLNQIKGTHKMKKIKIMKSIKI